MKATKTQGKPVHPADARRISFHGLSAKDVLAAMLKIKPEPKKPAKRRKAR